MVLVLFNFTFRFFRPAIVVFEKNWKSRQIFSSRTFFRFSLFIDRIKKDNELKSTFFDSLFRRTRKFRWEKNVRNIRQKIHIFVFWKEKKKWFSVSSWRLFNKKRISQWTKRFFFYLNENEKRHCREKMFVDAVFLFLSRFFSFESVTMIFIVVNTRQLAPVIEVAFLSFLWHQRSTDKINIVRRVRWSNKTRKQKFLIAPLFASRITSNKFNLFILILKRRRKTKNTQIFLHRQISHSIFDEWFQSFKYSFDRSFSFSSNFFHHAISSSKPFSTWPYAETRKTNSIRFDLTFSLKSKEENKSTKPIDKQHPAHDRDLLTMKSPRVI